MDTPVCEAEINVLLVDDRPERLLAYRAVLEDLGWNLIEARSAREALRHLSERDFAVVLLDVNMPDIDGFEAATLIRQHPRFEKTPIIFATAVHLEPLDRLKGYSVGAVDYISIPIVPQILRTKLSVLVELYQKRRELQALNQRLSRSNFELTWANRALQEEKVRETQEINRRLESANAELAAVNASLQGQITERTRAELALKEADRHKDEFLGVLSHELRNPLAAMHNAVQLMLHKRLDDAQLVRARDVVARQLEHLSRLVDDLLDVARITRGQINLSLEKMLLASVIERAVEIVRPQLEANRHELSVVIADPGMVVLGDSTRLTQAISNVLGNAAKYTNAGGKISLTASTSEVEAEIRVRDNGIGMSPEQLAELFKPFSRLNRCGEGNQSGLGIGLSLAQRLIEMHGGVLTAASEGAGCGSEFILRLPLNSSLAQRHQADGTTGHRRGKNAAEADWLALASSSVARRVLVADDNGDALESFAMLLQMGGHEVITASHGGTALQYAERHRPQIAFLDIGMPTLDGYEVARRIRSQPWGDGMMLVALTGWGQDSDRSRARDAGFDTHMVKPPDLNLLNQLLARLPAER